MTPRLTLAFFISRTCHLHLLTSNPPASGTVLKRHSSHLLANSMQLDSNTTVGCTKGVTWRQRQSRQACPIYTDRRSSVCMLIGSAWSDPLVLRGAPSEDKNLLYLPFLWRRRLTQTISHEVRPSSIARRSSKCSRTKRLCPYVTIDGQGRFSKDVPTASQSSARVSGGSP